MTVKDVNIRTMTVNSIDYICITDIAKQKNEIDPNGVIGNWMRNRNTIEYLGLWETLYNPSFNPLEFEGFRSQAGLNAFTLSPTQWIDATNAIGLITKAGRYGGTYARSDIAFKFANWVSVEFELYLVMEFQRLKAKEQEQIGWTAKRELSKINYRIHTDAIKSNLIPAEVTREQAAMKYAEEADVLNVAMPSNGEKPIQTSKATFATMPPLMSSSVSRIWKISTPCSSTTVCHRVNDSSNSIRLPYIKCKCWRITRVGSC
jgi:hypothetical protein